MTELTPVSFSTFSTFFCGGALKTVLDGPSFASKAWPAANLAMYYPFAIPWRYTVRRFLLVRGATPPVAQSVGIYTLGGKALYTSGTVSAVSGSTAGTYHTLSTPLTLDPGRYYLGISMDSTSNAANGITIQAGRCKLLGLQEQSSAHPVPATAAFTQADRTVYTWVGLTRLA